MWRRRDSEKRDGGKIRDTAEEGRRGSLEGDGRQDKLKKVEIEERK